MKHRLLRLYTFLAVLFSFCIRLVAQNISSTDTNVVHTMHGTYYHDRFVGRKTSNGEIFTQDKYTAAHHSLKFGTLLLVTNPQNNSQVIVRVNDRCPKKGILDLTRKAAKQIDVSSTKVRVQVLPERYYSYWEKQESILEVLSSGRFIEYARKNEQPSIRQPMPADDPLALYDIELMKTTSRSTAKSRIARLPVQYQDRVDVLPASDFSGYTLHLSLSLSMPKAKAVLEQLKGSFPDAKIVKTK